MVWVERGRQPAYLPSRCTRGARISVARSCVGLHIGSRRLAVDSLR